MGAGDIIPMLVQAALDIDVHLGRALVGLGLHWCDSVDDMAGATVLREMGCQLLLHIFITTSDKRRELLNIVFSAVLEGPSASIKSAYCGLLEAILIGDYSTLVQFVPARSTGYIIGTHARCRKL